MTAYRPRELAQRRDAQVLRAEALDQTSRMAAVGTELHVGPGRWQLLGAVNKMAARGEVRIVQADPRWNATRGEWQIRVVRLKPAAPPWRKPLLITLAIVSPVMLAAGLLWWVLTALATLPVIAFCGFALLVLGTLAVRGRRPRITMSQRIDIR